MKKKLPGIRNLWVIVVAIAITFSLTANSAELSVSKRKALVKAEAIVLSSFEIEGATLSDALIQLYCAGKDADPKGKGVNLLLEKELVNAPSQITLKLKNVTLAKAAEQLAKSADLQLSAEDYGLFLKANKDAAQSGDLLLKN